MQYWTEDDFVRRFQRLTEEYHYVVDVAVDDNGNELKSATTDARAADLAGEIARLCDDLADQWRSIARVHNN